MELEVDYHRESNSEGLATYFREHLRQKVADIVKEYEKADGTPYDLYTDGLKIFDVSNPRDIQLIKHFDFFTAFDVIPLDGLLLVVGPDNVYQFDYSDLENIKQVSQIPYGA